MGGSGRGVAVFEEFWTVPEENGRQSASQWHPVAVKGGMAGHLADRPFPLHKISLPATGHELSV